MRINMYSIADLLKENYCIPFSCGFESDFHYEAIRKFMYMLTINNEMRIRAADYNLFLYGIFDDVSGEMDVDNQFNTIVNGSDVVKYLDDPSVQTFEIIDKIINERK